MTSRGAPVTGKKTISNIKKAVRRLYVGLQSFRSMSRMDASLSGRFGEWFGGLWLNSPDVTAKQRGHAHLVAIPGRPNCRCLRPSRHPVRREGHSTDPADSPIPPLCRSCPGRYPHGIERVNLDPCGAPAPVRKPDSTPPVGPANHSSSFDQSAGVPRRCAPRWRPPSSRRPAPPAAFPRDPV